MTPPRKKPAINGEHGAIIEEIHKVALQVTAVATAQKANHEENKRDIKELKDKTNELPCMGHKERLNNIDQHICEGKRWRLAIVVALIGLFGLIATGLVTWGKMVKANEQIDVSLKRMGQHIKKDEARWEYYKLPTVNE